MKSLKEYNEKDLQTFRVEISDFIHQEIYRCLQKKRNIVGTISLKYYAKEYKRYSHCH